MRKFLLKALLLIPIIGTIAITNYYIDPSHVYNGNIYADKIVSLLQTGYNCTNIDANFNERYLKKILAQKYEKKIDNLILGSSRVMMISEDELPNSKNLNLGVSSARIEDIIALYEICKLSGIQMKRLLIGIDPQFFNESNANFAWFQYHDYYYRFQNEEWHNKLTNCCKFELEKIKNLISVSYFKSAIYYYLTQKKELAKTKKKENLHKTFCPDGSLVYEQYTRNRDQKTINLVAANMEFVEWNNFDKISPKYVWILQEFVNSVKKDGIEIFFIILPWHPSLYKSFRSDPRYSVFNQTMQYIYDFSSNNNIPTIGSYNCLKCACDETCFYDGGHLNKKGLKQVFKNYHIE